CHHLIERIPEAVNVKTVEANALALGQGLIVRPKPLGQGRDLLVGPHPRWPTLEGVQHLASTGARLRQILDIAIDAVAIGPLAFYRYERETPLFDKPAA